MSRAFRVEMIPGHTPPVVHCNQFEKGDTWRFELYYNGSRYEIPGGATVKITGTKKDKAAYEVDCTVSNNEVVCIVTEQMTAAAGKCITELMVVNGDVVLYSANFVVAIEPAAVQGDLSNSEIPLTIVDADGNVYIRSDIDAARESVAALAADLEALPNVVLFQEV